MDPTCSPSSASTLGKSIANIEAAAKCVPGIVLAAAFCCVVLGCFTETPCHDEGQQDMPSKTIQEVQEAHTPAWMVLPGVVGTAIGQQDGRPCIKVYVAEATDELKAKIPPTVEGYPVALEVTGEFHAL